MKRLLFTVFLGCLAVVVRAQGTGAVYAAPGMQVKLQRGLPAEVIRVRKPFLTDPLPRFWIGADSVLQLRGQQSVLQAVRSRLRFPKAAMMEGVRGSIYVRAFISPEGTPTSITVVGRSTALESVNKEALKALDAETIRVVELLRFVPKQGSVDTLTIPMGFFFE